MSSSGVAKNGGVTGRREAALRRFHEEEDLERVYDMRMVVSLWPFVRQHASYLWGSLVLLVAMAGFGLVRPLVMREALVSFQEPGGAARVTRLGFVLAGVILAEQVMAFPQMYWLQLAGARGMGALRSHVFRFLHTRSMGFFDRTPIGRLMTRVTNDVDAISEMFGSGALNAVGDLIRLVAIVGIMLSLDWRMSLFAFAVLPPVALFVNWTRKRMRVAYREVRAKTARMNAYLNEQVTGIAVVQAYARESHAEAAFDEINYAYRAANMRSIVLDAALDAAIEMVSSVCIAAVLWYAGARTVAPDLSFATLFAMVAYIDMFFQPVRNLSARYTQIQSALAGAERVFQLLASEDHDARVEASSPHSGPARHPQTGVRGSWPGDTEHAFRLVGVGFAYKQGVPVLHDVDLDVRRGEIVAVVGPTGSGKTTLASLLLRLYDASTGRVEVFDRDVLEIDRATLRGQFAVVPQDVFLFPGSVATNVAAGDAEPDRARVETVLARIGALDSFQSREGGLDAPVLERGSNFSAGERQLIAFARALYRDPPLLILDEPTANIDSDTEVRLQQAMDAAMQGRTALIIAHRLSTIKSATRVVVMHQGRVAEQGSHDELMELDGIYARLHKLQAARREIQERVGALIA